jgi:probable rRNA maturation factor
MRHPDRGARPVARSTGGARSRRIAKPRALTIDVIVQSALWKPHRGLKARLRRAIGRAASETACRRGEVAVLLADDAAVRALNRDWRGRDKPTNVLSFPTRRDPSAAKPPGTRSPIRLLGDIVIAYETSAREATAAQIPLQNHAVHLAVHGFLHLMGHDHEAEAEADAMEALEAAILAQLDVPNPYPTRDAKP